ncbi:hypothetical protein KIW84_012394 [Lathyrus oleraceus]|uniref:Ubiquitin-like protease family profile domain-containing protein n=1 Tax=Pisum sativum TaxID=3888 RepID=A0A9D5BHJ6_PEA|nr:hypothetical protein KIW84_012394 [Pisum sativum]
MADSKYKEMETEIKRTAEALKQLQEDLYARMERMELSNESRFQRMEAIQTNTDSRFDQIHSVLDILIQQTPLKTSHSAGLTNKQPFQVPGRMLKKAGKDIPTKSGTKTNPKSQKEVPGQMLDKASKEIPTTSGTKSQIMMRLEKMVEESYIMHGAIRSVDMDEGVFGISHSELIAKEDMQQLFEHEELGIVVIHTYIWYMYDTLMRGTELCNRFNFIAASRINTTFITKNPTSVMNELVDRFMVVGDNTTPSLYFLPFNSGNGGHWVLVAMDLSRLMVYYLDSLPGDWSKYPSMKKTIDAEILKFRSKKNYRNRKDITWVRVQCPQQNNSIDCGFFVLRFMRDIIALNRIDIPKMYDDDSEKEQEATEPPDLTQTALPQTNIEHHLSLNSMKGANSLGTLRFLGKYGKLQVQILIDGESSDNFVQLRIAHFLKLLVEPAPCFKVLVENGQTMTAEGVVTQLRVVIQNHEMLITAYLLPVVGADLILGTAWLATLGPHVADYSALTLKLFHKGNFITLQGDTSMVPRQAQLHQLKRMQNTKSIDELFTVERIQTEVETNVWNELPSKLAPEVAMILDIYRTIFSTPKGLPPQRLQNHAIPLKEGTSPVKVKPYRYPHSQKERIEKMVLKMLDQGHELDLAYKFNAKAISSLVWLTRVQSPLHLLPNSYLKDGHEDKSCDPTVLVIPIGLLQLEGMLDRAKTLRITLQIVLVLVFIDDGKSASCGKAVVAVGSCGFATGLHNDLACTKCSWCTDASAATAIHVGMFTCMNLLMSFHHYHKSKAYCMCEYAQWSCKGCGATAKFQARKNVPAKGDKQRTMVGLLENSLDTD